MDRKDIPYILKLLLSKKRNRLADLIRDAQGEIDESSTYGSYLNSTISQYLFYLPVERIQESQSLSPEEEKALLECVLQLHPHEANAPEIRGIAFRVLRNARETEAVGHLVDSPIDHEFVREQLAKCRERIERDDLDGAITSAGSLLEGVFDDIHKKATGRTLGKVTNLRDGYKQVKGLLRLSQDHHVDESVRSVLHGLTAVVAGLDALRSQLGDRHQRVAKPSKRHAKLCVTAAQGVTEFLYETLAHQQAAVGQLDESLLRVLDSDLRFLEKPELESNKAVAAQLAQYDQYLKNAVKDLLVQRYEITRFRESDIFFAAMRLFSDVLTELDVGAIFQKNSANDQACGLRAFLLFVRDERPELLTKEVERYVRQLAHAEGQEEAF